MGIEALKLGFINYLKELSEKTSKEYSVENSDVSVFAYSSEFKSYISDELSVSSEFSSMSVNDILDMEVSNGKLVNPNETIPETETNIFTEQQENSTETNNNISLNAGEFDGTMISDVETPEIKADDKKENQSIITDILNFLLSKIS